MIVFRTLQFLNLDWDNVDKDLARYSDDGNYLVSVINSADKSSKDWPDNLFDIQQEHRKHGFTEHNTKIWKSTNKRDPLVFDWQSKMLSQLPLEHAVVALTRQDPGQILPWHQDKHFMLKRLYPNDHRMIVRILVFMQEWKTGHVLQIHNEMLCNWKRGQAIIWHPDTYHLAANVGLEKKWTCNITGFLNDSNLIKLVQAIKI